MFSIRYSQSVCIYHATYIDDDNDQEEIYIYIYKTWKDNEDKIYIIPSEYSLVAFVLFEIE